jgi:membrane protein
MSLKSYWGMVKQAGSEWWNDKAPRLGAALAFYITFSLAPLLVLVVAIAGFAFGREAAAGQLTDQLRDLVGEQGGAAIQSMIANASKPSTGVIATVTSAVVLLFGAAGLFGQLQDALNTIWEVNPPGGGIWAIIKRRFLSFSMVLGTSFLLLASLVVSTALSAITRWIDGGVAQIGHFLLSFFIITALFAMLFRFLPDTEVSWRNVWFGAFVTSLLFNIGKHLIGLYLGRSAVGSAFGAAGSLAVLLTWLYYSAQIFLFGAELTKAHSKQTQRVEAAARAA